MRTIQDMEVWRSHDIRNLIATRDRSCVEDLLSKHWSKCFLQISIFSSDEKNMATRNITQKCLLWKYNFHPELFAYWTKSLGAIINDHFTAPDSSLFLCSRCLNSDNVVRFLDKYQLERWTFISNSTSSLCHEVKSFIRIVKRINYNFPVTNIRSVLIVDAAVIGTS